MAASVLGQQGWQGNYYAISPGFSHSTPFNPSAPAPSPPILGPGESYVGPPNSWSGHSTDVIPSHAMMPPILPLFPSDGFNQGHPGYGHSAAPVVWDFDPEFGHVSRSTASSLSDESLRHSLFPYRRRADNTETPPALKPIGNGLPPLPIDFKPWWVEPSMSQLRESAQPFWTNIETLTVGALQHSPHIKSIRQSLPIQETAIVEAQAEFDWTAFLETQYDDRSDPIGSRLTTGNTLGRFRDHQWTGSSGLRTRLDDGGQFEVSQQLGYQDNNSTFLVPRPQSTARLAVSYTQPLLRQSGRAYNTSRILLAEIDTRVSLEELRSGLQEHLMQVTEAYWTLFQSRATYLQKRKLYDNALGVLQKLESRRELDAMQAQIVRAQAAVTRRVSEIIRAEVGVRNAETRIRMLVNPNGLPPSGQFELVPRELPSIRYMDIPLSTSMHMALYHRPDITQAMQRVKSNSVRAGMARHELLPKLDLVLSTYVAGLAGDTQQSRSFEKQFRQGEPGFSVGVLFEIPLGNRAAKSRHTRLMLELQQSVHRMHATIETALAEVEIASREVDAAYQQMQAGYQALQAAETETRFLNERWQLLLGQASASLMLENLLSAQERLAAEEERFVAAQVRYAVSLTQLKRVTGTSLDFAEPRAETHQAW